MIFPSTRMVVVTLLSVGGFGFAGTFGLVGQAVYGQGRTERAPYYDADTWYDISRWADEQGLRRSETTAYPPVNEPSAFSGDIAAEADDDFDVAVYDYDPVYTPGEVMGEYLPPMLYEEDYDFDLDQYQYDPYDYDYIYDDFLLTDDGFGHEWYGYGDILEKERYEEAQASATSFRDYDNDGLYDYSYRYFTDRRGRQNNADVPNPNRYRPGPLREPAGDRIPLARGPRALDEDGGLDAGQSPRAVGPARQQSVSGEILNITPISVRNSRNLLVVIERYDNSRVLADLGPLNQLGDVMLREGETIWVRGPVVAAGGRRVLMAAWVKAGDAETEIARGERRFRGRVASLRTAMVQDRTHQLAMVSFRGQTRLVDFGPVQEQRFQLSEGDRVTVSGPTMVYRGSLVLLANEVMVDGERYRVRRPESV